MSTALTGFRATGLDPGVTWSSENGYPARPHWSACRFLLEPTWALIARVGTQPSAVVEHRNAVDDVDPGFSRVW